MNLYSAIQIRHAGVLLLLCVTVFSHGQNLQQGAPLSQEERMFRRVLFDKDESPRFIWFDQHVKTGSQFSLEKVLGLPKGSTFRLRSKRVDVGGQEHLRYVQTYKGLEILGAEYILHKEGENAISANGNFEKEISVNTQSHISETTALQLALDHVGAKVYMWEVGENEEFLKRETENANASFLPKASLVLSRERYDKGEPIRLVYQFDIYSQKPLGRYNVEIDATTGAVINLYNKIHTITTEGTGQSLYDGVVPIVLDFDDGTYYLSDNTRGGGILTYDLKRGTSYRNATLFSEPNNHFDQANSQAGVSAHFGATAAYMYFLQNFQRDSYDDAGAPIRSYVHYSNGFVNAFWDGSRMTYGDGDGRATSALVSLDIVGHEISHAVTEHSADLVYSYESGALNESFSDIFGQSIEFANFPETASWNIGDQIYFDGESMIRSMSHPNSKGHPDTYHGDYWYSGSGDSGGVHYNSGVQNFWYYLLVEGGTGTNDNGYLYNVAGIGLEKAQQIAYRNLTVYLTSTSDYSDARVGAEQAAVDLFGWRSNEHLAVVNAWNAVGVPALSSLLVVTDSLDFGKVGVGSTQELEVVFSNVGSGSSEVRNIQVNNDLFTVSDTAFSLEELELKTVFFDFTPGEFDNHTVTYTIFTNEDTLIIQGTAEGVKPPTVQVTLESIQDSLFVNTTSQKALSIYNEGELDLTYELIVEYDDSTSEEWLGVSTPEGSILPGDSTEFILELSANGMTGGVFQSNLMILTNDPARGVSEVPVALTVFGIPEISVLDEVIFSPTYVGYPDTARLEVGNSGTDVLELSFFIDDSVYMMNLASATVAAGEISHFDIVFDPKEAVFYNHPLLVVTNQVDQDSFYVDLSGTGVLPPELALDKQQLTASLYSGDKTMDSLTVSNLEEGSELVWQLSLSYLGDQSESWLSVSLFEDTLTVGQESNIFIEFDADDLYGGVYNAELAISTNDPSQKLKRIPVVLEVTGIPVIDISEDTLLFERGYLGYMDSVQYVISNLGTEDLLVQVDLIGDQFHTDVDEVVVYPDADTSFWVFFTPDWLGHHDGQLLLTSNDDQNDSLYVPLVGIGKARPVFEINQFQLVDTLDAGSVSSHDIVVQCYEGTLIWNAQIRYESPSGNDEAWLGLSSNHDTLQADQTDSITLELDASGLNAGVYQATILFFNNDPESVLLEIPVQLLVFGFPEIHLSSDTLNFGEVEEGTSKSTILTIFNQGTDSLLISSLVSNHPDFTIEASELALVTGEEKALNVTYMPSTINQHIGALQILSNDPNESNLRVSLSGLGVPPSNIPPAMGDTVFYLSENSPAGSLIGTLQASDPDGDTLTYRILSGNDSFAFQQERGGSLLIHNSAMFNYELNRVFELIVEVSDGTNSDTAQVRVGVIDENDRPAVMDTVFEIPENSANGYVVGYLYAEDEDNDSLSYSITDGNDFLVFGVSEDGMLSVWDSSGLNFENQLFFELRVEVSDHSLKDSSMITIHLTDVNDRPVVVDQTFEVFEHSPMGTLVGYLSATDEDGDTLVFEMDSHISSAAFEVSVSGELTVNDPSLIDFEEQEELFFDVIVTDLSEQATFRVTVTLLDINENTSPSFSDQTFEIPENSPKGTEVGYLVAEDLEGDFLTFTILNSEESPFELLHSQLLVADSSRLDYEVNTSFELIMAVSDGIESDTALITIHLTDIDENTPPVMVNQSFSVQENSPVGYEVGQIQASDANGDMLTFSITSGNSGNSLTLSPEGKLFINDSSHFDFETTSFFELVVAASDGSLADTAMVSINVIDLDETPENHHPVILDQSFSVEENTRSGVAVGTVEATDEDGDSLSFEIISGNSEGTFVLDGVTGILSVGDTTALDYEVNRNISFIVQVSDLTSSDIAIVSIQITDQVETGPLGLDSDHELLIYPNPSLDGHVSVENGRPIRSLKLLDTSGKMLVFVQGEGRQEIGLELSDFDRGVYYLIIEDVKGQLIRKLILE